MKLWLLWWAAIRQLRPAFSRLQTFLWFSCVLVGMTVRSDLFGITSIVRALGLKESCYDRILDLFHSAGFRPDDLARRWVSVLLSLCRDSILQVNKRIVLVGDGLKVPKAGKKMPGVKLLHQESESNTKPEFIMGHSCQAISLLVSALEGVFAIPLISRIHEGVVFSNRHKRTLLDKMVVIANVLEISLPYYLVLDAFYCSRTLIRGLLAQNNHLISRVRSNAVAYFSAKLLSGPKQPGRPPVYGKKIKLRSLFDDTDSMTPAPSVVYGEKNTQIRFRSLDLLWRPVGLIVRFVAVIHPTRGRAIFLCTDLSLAPLEIIRLYSLRFKIEVSFKQATRSLGVYSYHFWMRTMTSIRSWSGNQYLHRKNEKYRNAVRRKLDAYHRHIQAGLIAQGMLQYLSSLFPNLVWESFGSWLRTIRPGVCPSEKVTVSAMSNCFPQFLRDSRQTEIIAKFICERIDSARSEGQRLIA